MVMSFGLQAALDELCESINSSGLIHCRFQEFGMDDRLEQQTEIELYRIAQELLSNVLKHARAKTVNVQINKMPDTLLMTVEDDGVGFDVAEKRRSGGLGLKNLEARAARLNGTYHVESRPGAGSISIIEIPINKAYA
jgi:signal transduction histidine kinase